MTETRHRPLPLGRALRALRRDADDRPRRHRRERRASIDPGGPRVLPVQSRLGRQRVPDRVRRPAAARRPARRPDLPARRLPRRPRRLHRRLGPVRRRAEPGDADRGPLRPGRRRRDGVRRDPRHDRDDVPGAAGAGEGDRRLRLRRLRGRLDRPAGRRRPDPVDQLALDLLRQHPDRDRHGAAGDAPDREGQGHRPRPRRRLPRRGPDHGLPDARRLHDRQAGRRHRLDLRAHPRVRGRRARAAGGLPGARVDRARAADPAADLPLAQRLRAPTRSRRCSSPGCSGCSSWAPCTSSRCSATTPCRPASRSCPRRS